MKQSLKSAEQIYAELRKKIQSKTKIKIDKKGQFPGINNTIQYAVILVKSNDRADTYGIVLDTLKDMGVKCDEEKVPGSSFNAIVISDYNKFGKKEKGLRILFKFPDGSDSKDFNIWNDMLVKHVFVKNPNLKRQPSNRYEVNVIKNINNKIQDLGNGLPVSIRIKNKKYTNIAGMIGGVGTKKSDFVLVTYDGQEVSFISYKDGSTSMDFQQYGGISPRVGDSISNNLEVKKFNEDVVNNWESLSQDFNSVYRRISDRNLKKQSVFGKDYKKASGYDSVDFFVQGNPRITKRGNIIYITFSSKVVRKGDLSPLSRDYDPVLGARKGEKYRKIKSGNKTISGIRGGIWSYGYMRSRSKTKEI
jgi:hypothetical protein